MRKSNFALRLQPSLLAEARKVAEAEKTCAAAVREVGSSIVAMPDTTLQLVETMGCRPELAWPWRAKAVELPCEH